jgi:hypothetical protein
MGSLNGELAALIDAATGDQIGEVLAGSQDRLDLRPHLHLLQPGRRYLHVHTHPASSGFSDLDLTVLLAYVEIRTLVVVTQDGAWYFLSKVRGQPTADPTTGGALWDAYFAVTAQPHHDLIARGTLSRDEALRQEVHDTMIRLAPEIGLRYDWLEALG